MPYMYLLQTLVLFMDVQKGRKKRSKTQKSQDTAQTEEFKQAKGITGKINQDNENSPATETGKSLFLLFRAFIKRVQRCCVISCEILIMRCNFF